MFPHDIVLGSPLKKAKEACERKGSTPASAKEEIKNVVTETVAVETVYTLCVYNYIYV